MLRRLTAIVRALFECPHRDVLRERHPGHGWVFRCQDCNRYQPVVDRSDLRPPIPKFVGTVPPRPRGDQVVTHVVRARIELDEVEP